MKTSLKEDILFVGVRYLLPGLGLVLMHVAGVKLFLIGYSILVQIMGAFYLSVIIIQDLSDLPEIQKLISEQRYENNYVSFTRALTILFEIYVAVQATIFGVYIVPASLIATACIRQAVVGTSFVK